MPILDVIFLGISIVICAHKGFGNYDILAINVTMTRIIAIQGHGTMYNTRDTRPPFYISSSTGRCAACDSSCCGEYTIIFCMITTTRDRRVLGVG